MQRRGSRLRNIAVNLTPNTFIGNVSSVLNSAQALASKLSTPERPVSASDIPYFAIVGSDIEAAVNVDYNMIGSTAAFHTQSNTPNATYYRDEGGRCKAFNGTNNFFYADQMRDAYFPEVTTIGDGCFISRNNYTRIYIPKCTTLGGSLLDNQVLYKVTGTDITVPISLQTANGGAEEGDVAAARSKGATIIYV